MNFLDFIFFTWYFFKLERMKHRGNQNMLVICLKVFPDSLYPFISNDQLKLLIDWTSVTLHVNRQIYRNVFVFHRYTWAASWWVYETLQRDWSQHEITSWRSHEFSQSQQWVCAEYDLFSQVKTLTFFGQENFTFQMKFHAI